MNRLTNRIDYFIDLNNLAKFGFGKNFPGRRYTYPTYKGSSFISFFLNFLRLLMRVQPKRLNRFLRRNMSIDVVW